MNATDSNHDGLVDHPDDDGAKPAGILKFKFKTPQSSLGFDLIDIDGPTEYNANTGYVSFRSGGTEVARVGWGAFIDPSSKYYDRTVKYGNRTADRINPIDINQLGIRGFDEAWFYMGSSSAIDSINFDNSISVIAPEPASLAVLSMGMILGRRRAKR